MGQLLRICMDLNENEVDWQVLYNKFDSRNGFQMVTLGIDYHEDCELLKQISKALDFDLSFIKFPEGRAYDGGLKRDAATIEEFIFFFQELLKRLDDNPNYYTQINYRYLSVDYFRKKQFNIDIQTLIDFLEYHNKLGAMVAWFKLR